MKYNDKGEELVDDTPMEVPLNFRRPPSIQELIAMHVKAQFQMERVMGKEDENDFSEAIEGDDILTPYELDAQVADADAEFRRAEQSKAVLEKYRKKKDNKDTVNSDRIKDDHGSSKAGSGISSDASVGKTDIGSKRAGSEVAGGSEEADC